MSDTSDLDIRYVPDAPDPAMELVTCCHDVLLLLHESMRQLSVGAVMSVDAVEDWHAKLVPPVDSLVLVTDESVPKYKDFPASAIRLSGRGDWVWRASREKWLECIELVENVLDAGYPCHIYLTESIHDDVEVVLCYCEEVSGA